MTTRTAPRLISLFSAAALTFAMLTSVNGLAISEPTAAQMAQMGRLAAAQKA